MRGDGFGFRVSLDASRAIVSSISGSTYVFELIGDQWVETEKLIGRTDVSLDGDTAIMSVEGEEVFVHALISLNSCDYSNAAFQGGWGWNQSAQTSCAPLAETSENACDYVYASLHNGWGWNPVTGESCPPLCIDTDGDGWGWNGIRSCQVR